MDSAVFQAERLASRMSERSSQTRFWNNNDMKGVATQSFGREGTTMNELRVWTTANRTFGIVCRKNGNKVWASVESGRLEALMRKGLLSVILWGKDLRDTLLG